jgi:error-prone DNA polymerase
MVPGYAELHCVSNYTFLRGASDPEELIHRAAQLGYAALAITDECSVSGIVRAHLAAKDAGIRLLVGSELGLACGLRAVLLAQTLAGYESLCELITRARRAAPKGAYRLSRGDFPDSTDGLLALWLPATEPKAGEGAWLRSRFPGRAWIAVELHKGPNDAARLESLSALGEESGLPLLATGDAHMHRRSRKRLQDVLTAIRLRMPVAQAGRRLQPNGERYLRPIGRIA